MNTFISVVYSLFALKQKIYIYVNGECQQIIPTTLKELDEKLYTCCELYNIDRIYLNGNNPYARKTQQNFTANKYGKKNITVTINS